MVKIFGRELDFGGSVSVVNPSRRGLMKATGAIAAAGLLAACSVTKENGVTTITIDVNKIKNYGQGGLNAVAMIMAIQPISAAIPPAIRTAISVSDKALSAALKAFSDAAGGKLQIVYNDANWKTRVDSVLSSLEQVDSDLKAAVAAIEGQVSIAFVSDANVTLSAIDAVISFFKAITGSLSATPANTAPHMTEDQALSILGVKRAH